MMKKLQLPLAIVFMILLSVGALVLFWLPLPAWIQTSFFVPFTAVLVFLTFWLDPKRKESAPTRVKLIEDRDRTVQEESILDHIQVDTESVDIGEPEGAESFPDLEELDSQEDSLQDPPVQDLGAEGASSPTLATGAQASGAQLQELRELLGQAMSRYQEMTAPTSSVEQDFSNLKSNAEFINENVVRAFEISDNLANTAKEAFELSENVQKGVKIVTDALSSSLQNTEELFTQSKKITKILEIMSDISEKIHILSINASIVSARAGVAGKGFEVVAKEIRNLAKETESSLLDIETVIEELQTTIGNVIEKVQVANKETEIEKNSLISVAGSLQGVILAVEIIRAVSSVARDKSAEQASLLQALIDDSQKTGEESGNLQLSQALEKIQLAVETMNQALDQ